MTQSDIKGVIAKLVNNVLSEGAGATVALLSAVAIWYIMHEQQKVEAETFKESIEMLRLERNELLDKLLECEKYRNWYSWVKNVFLIITQKKTKYGKFNQSEFKANGFTNLWRGSNDKHQ